MCLILLGQSNRHGRFFIYGNYWKIGREVSVFRRMYRLSKRQWMDIMKVIEETV